MWCGSSSPHKGWNESMITPMDGWPAEQAPWRETAQRKPTMGQKGQMKGMARGSRGQEGEVWRAKQSGESCGKPTQGQRPGHSSQGSLRCAHLGAQLTASLRGNQVFLGSPLSSFHQNSVC